MINLGLISESDVSEEKDSAKKSVFLDEDDFFKSNGSQTSANNNSLTPGTPNTKDVSMSTPSDPATTNPSNDLIGFSLAKISKRGHQKSVYIDDDNFQYIVQKIEASGAKFSDVLNVMLRIAREVSK